MFHVSRRKTHRDEFRGLRLQPTLLFDSPRRRSGSGKKVRGCHGNSVAQPYLDLQPTRPGGTGCTCGTMAAVQQALSYVIAMGSNFREDRSGRSERPRNAAKEQQAPVQLECDDEGCGDGDDDGDGIPNSEEAGWPPPEGSDGDGGGGGGGGGGGTGGGTGGSGPYFEVTVWAEPWLWGTYTPGAQVDPTPSGCGGGTKPADVDDDNDDDDGADVDDDDDEDTDDEADEEEEEEPWYNNFGLTAEIVVVALPVEIPWSSPSTLLGGLRPSPVATLGALGMAISLAGKGCEITYPRYPDCGEIQQRNPDWEWSAAALLPLLRQTYPGQRVTLGAAKPALNCDAGGTHYNVSVSGIFEESILCCNCCMEVPTPIITQVCTISYT